eukprot:gene12398-26082_t
MGPPASYQVNQDMGPPVFRHANQDMVSPAFQQVNQDMGSPAFPQVNQDMGPPAFRQANQDMGPPAFRQANQDMGPPVFQQQNITTDQHTNINTLAPALSLASDPQIKTPPNKGIPRLKPLTANRQIYLPLPPYRRKSNTYYLQWDLTNFQEKTAATPSKLTRISSAKPWSKVLNYYILAYHPVDDSTPKGEHIRELLLKINSRLVLDEEDYDTYANGCVM